jgi:hypothetical protein
VVVRHKYLVHEVALAEAPGTRAVASSSFVAAAVVVAAIAVVVDFAAAAAELAAVVATQAGSVAVPHQMNPLQLEMEEG